MTKERIYPLDGLRFLAAIGVLWIHSWTAFGNPRYYIWRIDVTNFLAIGGNGVDLFFVISGFCMYFFYRNNNGTFNSKDYFKFLKKRWLRLSPAFYTAALAYFLLSNNYSFLIQKIIVNIFYLNTLIPQYSAAAHFWTLGTEWQFYLIIPLILKYEKTIGFKKIFLTVFGIILTIAITLAILFKSNPEILSDSIFFRGSEFGAGILCARFANREFRFLRNANRALLLSLIFIFSGRILISQAVFKVFPHYYNLFKIAGFTIMSTGFALLLYLIIKPDNWLGRILSNSFFKNAGKISYSFYLWHLAFLPMAVSLLKKFLPDFNNLLAPILTTILAGLLLFPVAMISYHFLEKPFFGKKISVST